jgi:hypothetical protein
VGKCQVSGDVTRLLGAHEGNIHRLPTNSYQVAAAAAAAAAIVSSGSSNNEQCKPSIKQQ